MQPVSAHGEFVIARVKTWFDERTISAHRGNGPLTPNGRRSYLSMAMGEASDHRRRVRQPLPAFLASPRHCTTPLRPGESYTTDFVFDVPGMLAGSGLSITEDTLKPGLLIGRENSLFHKKIYPS